MIMNNNNNTIKENMLKYSDIKYLGSNEKIEFEHFLWEEKRKGRIYQFNFIEDDIKFIESYFDVILSDYKNYEINVNNKLLELITSNENELSIYFESMSKLKEYITSRIHDEQFITNIDFSLIDKYNEKIDNYEKLPEKNKKFYKIIL
jgi:hypothetical protein